MSACAILDGSGGTGWPMIMIFTVPRLGGTLVIACQNDADTSFSVSDNVNGAYSQQLERRETFGSFAFFHRHNVAQGETVVTVQGANGSNGHIRAFFLEAIAPQDVASSGEADSVAGLSHVSTATPFTGTGVVLCAVRLSDVSGYTVGSGYTNAPDPLTSVLFEQFKVGAFVSEQGSFTTADAVASAAIAALWSESAGGALQVALSEEAGGGPF